MPPVIENLPDSAVSPSLDRSLRDLLVTCFPNDPGFREHRHWKEPPLHRFLARDHDGSLIAHLCLHHKPVTSPAGPLLLAGVAEVCVRPSHRGQGLVRLLLTGAHQWIAQRPYDFAMLFGKTAVYSSSGYTPISNPLRFFDDKSSTFVTHQLEGAMIRPFRSLPWPQGPIDLQGPVF